MPVRLLASAIVPRYFCFIRGLPSPRRWLVGAFVIAAIGLGACGTEKAATHADATRPAVLVPPPELPVSIASPSGGSRVTAHLVNGQLRAVVRVRGYARAGRAVRVSTRCGTRSCTRRVVPPAGGRWETHLRVLAPGTARSWRIAARYADGGAAGRAARVRVRLVSPELQAVRAQSRHPATSRAATTTPPAGPAGVTSGSGGQVLVVGDSLEVLTSPYLQRHLPGTKLTINAKGGYSSLQIFDLFRQSFSPSQSVIVFDAGTNDNPHYPQILAGRLQAVSQIVGNRCLVVPTIHGLTVDGVTSRGKNRVVRSFAASRPGTQTPDWAAAVREHPELMQADHLHPIAAGADYRAQLIAAGVRACMLG